MHKEMIEVHTKSGTIIQESLLIQNSDSLVVLLPGNGYTLDAPLLYYSYSMAMDFGYDILSMEYGFQKENRSFSKDEFGNVVWEVSEAMHIVRQKYNYKRVVLIGKSLGTVIMRELSSCFTDTTKIVSIFLTPVEEAQNAIFSRECLVVIGTKDGYYEKLDLTNMQKSEKIQLLTIEGADHSLDTEDCASSLRVLNDVIREMKEYIVKK